MNCPICGNQIINNERQCRKCGYIIQHNQQNMNYGYSQQNMNYSQQMQQDYGYQQENKNTKTYYENNTQGYQCYSQPKKESSIGIIVATILIGMLLCCGAPLGITLVGLNIIGNTDVLEDNNTTKDNDYYDPEFGYGGQKEEWENKEITVLSDEKLNLDIRLVEDSIVTEKGNVEFKLDIYNKGPEMVDISITDVEINDREITDYDSESIRLGSNTVIDGYNQTKYDETFNLRSNIGEIESFKFKFKIYYPNLDKSFETTEFYITEYGFSYEANVIDAEEIVASNENEDNSLSADNNKGLNYYGSEYVGYVILDGVWVNFRDVEGSSLTETTVQYSNGSRILTMDMYKDLTAHVLGNNLHNNLSYNSNIKDVIVLDDSYEDNIEYYQLLAEYNDGTLWTVMLLTDYNTGNTLYFSYETYLGGADEEEFLKEAHNIISTYTVETGEVL